MLFEKISILDKNFDCVSDMYVGTHGAHIVYIDKKAPKDKKKYGRRFAGAGKLLMPAFYNTHAHTPMTLLRGYAENLPLQRWLKEAIWPVEAAFDPARGHHYWACMLSQAEMLSYGVVSYTDMYFATKQRVAATLDAHMKANHCEGSTMCFTETPYEQVSAYSINEELFERFASEAPSEGGGRIKIDMCIHGEYTTPQSMIERCIVEAYKHDTGLHMHLAETKAECDECKKRHDGMSPVAYFASLGAFDLPCTAAHCVWLDAHDIEILAKHAVNVSLNPASNMKLASGYAPVQAMLDAGVRLSIGTDGMASNNTHNILQSAYLLACSQKGYARDPVILTPKQLLFMLTRAGALCQRREDCGVLALGMRADLIVMNIDTPSMMPVYDMATNLIYSANAADVILTMCDGEVLYEAGEYKSIDIEKTKAEFCRCVKELNPAADFCEA